MSPTTEPESIRFDRREFCVILAGAAVLPAAGWSHGTPSDRRHRRQVAFYSSTGPQLWRYDVGERALTLRRREAVVVPAAIQYAWPHPSRRLLYVAYSNRAGANPGTVHGVDTLRIDGRGRLHPVGQSLALPTRPIHITVDATGSWLLVAFNDPSGVAVHPLGDDGAPGPAVLQPEPIDPGVYAHQVRVTPSNTTVILPTRGNDATDTSPEDPGALKVFDFVDGHLLNERTVAPDGGFGFGPRHVDFHPRQPWTYVSEERSNEMQVFELRDGTLSPDPLHTLSTLEAPNQDVPNQVAGPIHVSDEGRYVYLANRADGTTEFDGQQVFAGGENSIAVFRIDRRTGRPTRIQNAPTRGFHTRTFTLHPNGRMLVAASVAPMLVRVGDRVREVPAVLTVFRIRHDGRLAFVRRYDVDTSAGTQFWCGMVPY
jgi:6-phosphogluconolactonase (cycloisomerase 2 family)